MSMLKKNKKTIKPIIVFPDSKVMAGGDPDNNRHTSIVTQETCQKLAMMSLFMNVTVVM